MINANFGSKKQTTLLIFGISTRCRIHIATFLIFRDLMLTLLTFPAQGSSNDVYSPILLNLYFVIPLSLSKKILTIYLFQRIYEVGWPLLFFILVALFPHLNIANPSSFLRFPMTTNLFTFPKL